MLSEKWSPYSNSGKAEGAPVSFEFDGTVVVVKCARSRFRLNTLDTETLKSDLKALRRNDGIVVIDCPGNLNDNNLSAIYAMADLIVIPMAYDVDTIDATGLFVAVIRKMTSARLVFLPNRINTTEGKARELEMREETIAILGKLGAVTPRIKQSVVIKRYSTLQPLDKYQYAAVEHAFDRINDIIKNL